MDKIQEVLLRLGVGAESLSKIQLGQGVVGKSSYVISILFIACIVALCRISSDFLMISILICMMIAFFIFFFKIMNFAEKNPAEAILEGAHFVNYKRMDLAAQGIEPPQNDPLVEASSQTVPALPDLGASSE